MPDTTARRGITQPKADRSDPADAPLYIRNVAAAADSDVIYLENLIANIPAASLSGRIFRATDTGDLYFDTGTAWKFMGAVEVPVGGVMDWPWASGSIPAWASLPYANAIPIAGHPVLAALDTASATPHGTSAGNIVLPDYRGRIGAGKDDMGGTAANRITAAISGTAGTVLGAVIGSEGVTLTTGQLPAHNHGVTGIPGITDPGHAHDFNYQSGASANGTAAPSGRDVGPNNVFTAASGLAVLSKVTGITLSVGSLATSNAGSGSAHLNVQPTIIVNKLMRII